MNKESNNSNKNNLTSLSAPNSLNQLNLTDDSCSCRYCQARLIIKIGNFMIPLSEQDFCDLFVRESVFRSITPRMSIYPYNEQIFQISPKNKV